MRFCLSLFLFPMILGNVAGLFAAEITISAAISLTDALTSLAKEYERTHKDQITLNFEASGVLVKQIIEGAPVDLFISADESKMDQLQKEDLLALETRTNLLSNQLVLITAFSNLKKIYSPNDLTKDDIKKIAIGDPISVPAGGYAKQYLQSLGIWNKLETKIIPTANVRAVLAVVQAANADAGLVYLTDAQNSKTIRIAYQIPLHETPSITYPACILKKSKSYLPAKQFLEFLETDKAKKKFREYGFIVNH